MLIANYYSNKDIRLEDRPIPQAGKGECLIKIHASGICGSDLLEWYRKDKVPLVLGHEVAGEIVEIGENVSNVSIGESMVAAHHVPCLECRHCKRGHETLCQTLRSTNFFPGGFSQYVLLPEINTTLGLFRIPDNVTYEEASFAEPLACVIRGQDRTCLQKGDVVAVIGSGISGIMHIALAKASGAKAIIAADIVENRLDMAKIFGADYVTLNAKEIPTDLEKKVDQKADVVILTTGRPDVLQAGFESVNDGGTILLFAPTNPGETIPLNINQLFWKRDVTVTTTYAGSPNDHRRALDLIAEKKIPVKEMITHRISLEEIQYGFDLVGNGTKSLKVIVEPNRN